MTTPLGPTETGNYTDFRIRQALRILQRGGTEQDVVDYWAHLDERPGVRAAIETPVSVSREEQGLPQMPGAVGVAGNFVQGLTFNFGDEALGTIYGLLAPGVTTQEARDNYRAALAEYQQQAGGLETVATQIAGAIALGVLTAGTASALGAGGRVGQAANFALKTPGIPGPVVGGAVGAGSAALAGAGQATGPVGTRIQAATEPGPLIAGGVLGAAARPIVRGVVRAGGAVARGVRKLTGRESTLDELAELLPGSPSRQAREALRRALEADGITPQQALTAAQARIARGLPTTVGDIGGPQTGALITNAQMFQGPVQQQFANAVRMRQIEADPRALAVLGRSLRMGSQNAYDAVESLAAQQKAVADPLYQQAHQMTVTVGPKIRAMLELPEFRRAYDVGRSLSLMDDAAGVQRGLPIPEIADDIPGSLPVRALDYIKKGIQHLTEVAGAEGKSAVSREQARSMGAVLRNALAEVDGQVPVYAQARQVWQGFAEQMEAVALGYGGRLRRGQLIPRGQASFLTRKLPEITRELESLDPALRPYYRMGVLTQLADALHGPGPAAAEAARTLSPQRLFNDRALQLKIAALFDDPSAAREFMDRLSAEAAWVRMESAARPRTPSPTTATNRLLPQGPVGRVATKTLGAPRNISRGQMLGDELALLYMKGLEDPNELLAMLQALAHVGTIERGVVGGARMAAGQRTQ